MKDMQRNLKQSKSSFDKEKALLEQKVIFLEQTLKDQANRELNNTKGSSQKQSELSFELRSLTQKYENELKQIQSQLENQQEISADFEAQLYESKQILATLSLKHSEVEQTLTQSLTSSQQQIQDLQQQLQKINFNSQSVPIERLKQKEVELVIAIKQVEELEYKLKQNQEQNQSSMHENKKQVAMRDQKIEFLQMQLIQQKELLEESQRQHQNMINMLDNHDDQIKPKNDQHEQLMILNSELSSQYETLNKQIIEANQNNQTLQTKILQLERENQSLKQDTARQLQISKASIQDLEQSKLSLVEKLKQMESQLKQSNCESISLRQELTQQHKKELQDLIEVHSNEFKESCERSEQQILQIKQFFDKEKEKCDLRVTEQKERFQLKLQQIQNELEEKHKEDQQNYESEIKAYQEQLSLTQTQQASQIKQFEAEITNKQNLINQFQQQILELQDYLQSIEQKTSQTYESKLIQFEQQKAGLQQNIDHLTASSIERERLLSTLQHKNDLLEEQVERIKSDSTQSEQKLLIEKNQLAEKYENSRGKMGELQDELIQIKNETSRQQALLEQQVKFQQLRIEDMQRAADSAQSQFDEKIQLYRQEILVETQAQLERVMTEKELLDQKYEQKIRLLKEVETKLQSTVQNLEKQNLQLSLHITKLNSEFEQKEQSLIQENENLAFQLANKAENLAGDSSFLGQIQTEDFNCIKGKLQECEKELQNCQSNYDRDRELWENKCLFLEQQKDTYKRELQDSQRKFEMTLEQLQKRSNQEKEKQEANQISLKKMFESKFNNQTKDLVTANQILVSEYQQQIKRLESELAAIEDKQNFESRSKQDDVVQLERKLLASEQTVEQLNNELLEKNRENQNYMDEIQKQIEKEKEISKRRINDLDKKAKDAELRRQQLNFQVEKDRTGWLIEAEQYQRKVSELQDQIQSLERSKESLKKENDKLRGNNLNGIASGTIRSNSALGSSNYGGVPRFTLNSNILKKSNESAISQLPSQPNQKIVGDVKYSGISNNAANIVSSAFNKFKENHLKVNQLSNPQPTQNMTPLQEKEQLLNLQTPYANFDNNGPNRYK